MTKITLGFSSCPNDTFIFDAMVNGKIDTGDFEFETVIEDVEALNKWALGNELDMTKLSYNAFTHVLGNYILLDSGSALGSGCGPLLISKRSYTLEEISGKKVAIPGEFTTANFLFSSACKTENEIRQVRFDDVEDLVCSGKVDAGVIIHENRFTYEEKGLLMIKDLGEFWEEQTGALIPLGGIVVKRRLDPETQLSLNRLVRKSVEYAFENPESSTSYVQEHAKEMQDSAIQKHIDLYVNEYSVSLGDEGRKAVQKLIEYSGRSEVLNEGKLEIFVS